jgi:hypothetical protein
MPVTKKLKKEKKATLQLADLLVCEECSDDESPAEKDHLYELIRGLPTVVIKTQERIGSYIPVDIGITGMTSNVVVKLQPDSFLPGLGATPENELGLNYVLNEDPGSTDSDKRQSDVESFRRKVPTYKSKPSLINLFASERRRRDQSSSESESGEDENKSSSVKTRKRKRTRRQKRKQYKAIYELGDDISFDDRPNHICGRGKITRVAQPGEVGNEIMGDDVEIMYEIDTISNNVKGARGWIQESVITMRWPPDRGNEKPAFSPGQEVTFDDSAASVAGVGNIMAIIKVDQGNSNTNDTWYYEIGTVSPVVRGPKGWVRQSKMKAVRYVPCLPISYERHDRSTAPFRLHRCRHLLCDECIN